MFSSSGCTGQYAQGSDPHTFDAPNSGAAFAAAAAAAAKAETVRGHAPVDAVDRQLRVGQVAVGAVRVPLEQRVGELDEDGPVAAEGAGQRAFQQRPFRPRVQRRRDPGLQHRAVGRLAVAEQVGERMRSRGAEQARNLGDRAARAVPQRAALLAGAPGRELAERGLEPGRLRHVELQAARFGVDGAVKHQRPHLGRELLRVRGAEVRSV